MDFSSYPYSDAPLSQSIASAGFTDFDSWWRQPLPWLEPPNEERGGWSGVSLLTLKQPTGELSNLYVKRQHNHTRRTWRHPVRGVPTFMLEYHALMQLQALGIRVPKVIYFGMREQAGAQQAILVTQALEGYVSLDQLHPVQLTPTQLNELALQVGQTLRGLHAVGWQHRAMYPKHLFVAWPITATVDTPTPLCALIDLEKARTMYGLFWQQFTDLIPFFYRLNSWPQDWLKLIYAHYCGQPHGRIAQQLGWWWIQLQIKKRR